MGIAHLKKLLEDEREWTVAARVELLEGQSSHYEVNAEGDVIVSVRTLMHDAPIWAHLDSLAGGADGSGVWHIPEIGTEVIVAFDGGDREGDATIVGRTSGGVAPTGLAPGKVFVLGSSVEIRSPGGAAIKLPTLADHQAVVDKLNELMGLYLAHFHAVGSPNTGPPLPPNDTISDAPDPNGTDVIKAE